LEWVLVLNDQYKAYLVFSVDQLKLRNQKLKMNRTI